MYIFYQIYWNISKRTYFLLYIVFFLVLYTKYDKIIDVIINVPNINLEGGEYMTDTHFIIVTTIANVLSNYICKLLGIF